MTDEQLRDEFKKRVYQYVFPYSDLFRLGPDGEFAVDSVRDNWQVFLMGWHAAKEAGSVE